MTIIRLSIRLAILNMLLLSVHSTSGWGPCPKVFKDSEYIFSLNTPGFFYSLSQFSVNDYLGIWLDIYRNIDFYFAKGNCTQSLIYQGSENKILATNSELINEVNSSAKAEIFADASIQGQLYAKFYHFAPAGDYRVIHTDYTNTALVFSCTSVVLAHKKFAWILARNLEVALPDFYFKLIEEFGIPLESLHKTVHQNCK